jgi:hypothetical protein
MRDQECLTRSVVLSLPAEIDIGNAEHVGKQPRAAFAPGVTAVIAEMGLTVFCCTSGSRQLVAAYKRATSCLTNSGRNRELQSLKSCRAEHGRRLIEPGAQCCPSVRACSRIAASDLPEVNC